MTKSRAAVALGRMRWQGKSKAERAEHARMMAARLWATRREHMRAAARARWARWRAARQTDGIPSEPQDFQDRAGLAREAESNGRNGGLK